MKYWNCVSQTRRSPGAGKAMKSTDLRQQPKGTTPAVVAGCPNRALDAIFLFAKEDGSIPGGFGERRKLPNRSASAALLLSCYLRKVNELRRENDRLKRELSLLQRKWGAEPVQSEGAARSPLELQQLTASLERLLGAGAKEASLLGSLHDLYRSLERKLKEVAPRVSDQQMRALVVETMRLSLELWVESTRSSKAELARRSGQWSVYVNQDGWERTQGLDRYLELVTLPDHPRMKKVLRTADFVLQNCQDPRSLRERLEEALFRLRALQRPLTVTT
jgi:hypothetical protein